MRFVKYWCAFAALLLTVVGLMAGATAAASRVNIAPAASTAPGSGPQAQFGDPFAYCAVLGTIDAPDSRYTGPKVPEVVAQGLKKAFGAPAVYEWTCAKDMPEVVRQFTQPDARGFLSNIWYAISPNP
jgi:hypothetical protein